MSPCEKCGGLEFFQRFVSDRLACLQCKPTWRKALKDNGITLDESNKRYLKVRSKRCSTK